MGTDRRRVVCCLCRGEVDSPSGWCPNCTTYPINITPIRYCHRGHNVDPEGFCWGCDDWVLTQLDPKAGEWIDTGKIANRLGTVAEVKDLVTRVITRLDVAHIQAQSKNRDKEKEKQEMFDMLRADNKERRIRTSDGAQAGGCSGHSPAILPDEVPF